MPIDKTFGLADCLDIISANQRLETYKVTVNPHGIRPVLTHPPEWLTSLGRIADPNLARSLSAAG